MTKSNFKNICAGVATTAFATLTLSAATYPVSNTLDSGNGSLRQAIADANAGGGGDIICSNVTGVITLATNLPLITASVNITGPGTNLLTISGNNLTGIFQVASGTTNTFSDFTIANSYQISQEVSGRVGYQTVDFPGSAISNSGAMTVSSCVFSNCIVDGMGTGDRVGGAVYSTGPLVMQNCLFVKCGSSTYDSGTEGGCIYSSGLLNLNNCTLTNCAASHAPGILAFGPATILNNCLLTALYSDYGEGEAGAIYAGNLTLNSCVISNCEAGWEGGAMVAANVVANDTIFTFCGALNDAGGLKLSGTNSFYRCSFSHCEADSGAGIMNYGNTTLLNCTVNNNASTYASGSGIWNSGTLNLTNCTVSGNTSTTYGSPAGGGIYNVTNAIVNLTDCTIVSNSAGAGSGGGVFNSAAGIVNANDTIIANNSSNDFTGTLTSGGYNLIKNTTACTVTGNSTGNLYGVDPKLGPLQNNGGFTMTHALLAGSPAIDAGPTNASPNFDQRGLARPQGTADDIGAFEFGAAPAPAFVSLSAAGNGCFHIGLTGTPGFAYTLFRAPTLAGPWTQIGTASTGVDGCGLCSETNAPIVNAYYRAACQSH